MHSHCEEWAGHEPVVGMTEVNVYIPNTDDTVDLVGSCWPFGHWLCVVLSLVHGDLVLWQLFQLVLGYSESKVHALLKMDEIINRSVSLILVFLLRL